MYEGWKGMDAVHTPCFPSRTLSEMNLFIYWYGKRNNQQKLFSAMQHKKNDSFFQIFGKKTKKNQQSMKYFASLGTSASTAEKELLNTSVLYHLIVEMLPLRVDGHVIGSTFGLFTKKELSEPKKNCSAWCKLASIDDLNCEYPKLELFCCFFCYLT